MLLHQDILEDLDIQKSDLTSPGWQQVQVIYYKLMMEFGFSDFLDKPSAGQGDLMSVPSTWDECPESYAAVNTADDLLVALDYFFKSINHGKTINLGDLMEPEGKRTRRFLSAIVNYWYFCNSNFQMFSEVHKGVERRAKDKEALVKYNETLKTKVGKIRKSNAEDAIKERDLQEKIQEMLGSINELLRAVEALKERSRAAKEALMGAQAAEKRAERETEELKRKREVLRKAMKNAGDMVDMETDVARLRETGDALRLRSRELEGQQANVTAVVGDLSSVLDHLAKGQKTCNKLKALTAERVSAARHAEMVKSEVDDLLARIASGQQKRTEMQEQIATTARKWMKRVEMKEAEADMLKREHEEAVKSSSKEEIVVAESNASIERATGQLAVVEKTYAGYKDTVDNELLKWLEKVKRKAKELLAEEGELISRMKEM